MDKKTKRPNKVDHLQNVLWKMWTHFSIFYFLFFGFLGTASGSYADEPLLYDTFPPGFMWAAATSAYQVEGGWDADGKYALQIIFFLQK